MAKKINTRIQLKHDLEANWNKATDFVPMKGEVIIYDKELDPADGSDLGRPSNRSYCINYERVKIGDGYNTVGNLPFQPQKFTGISDINSSGYFYNDNYTDERDVFYTTPESFGSFEFQEFCDPKYGPPIGWTKTFYLTMDSAYSRYVDISLYFYPNVNDNLKPFVVPSKCIFPGWTLANTPNTGNPRINIIDCNPTAGSGAGIVNFTVYLPDDRIHDAAKDQNGNSYYNDFMVTDGLVKITLKKLSKSIVTIEPEVIITTAGGNQ